MSGVQFTGVSFDDMIAHFKSFGERATKAAVEALDETLDKGVDDVRFIIAASHTPTGEDRAAAGGNGPGRIDTGAMYDAVEKHIDEQGHVAIGSFGWLDDGSRGYKHASYQEPGTERVAGMNALFQAFAVAIPDFKRRLAAKGFDVQ